MRVRLPGIHSVIKKNGKQYHYAWRSGPRIKGKPGTSEFIASYNAAHENRKKPDPKKFFSIIRAYRQSADFKRLHERTQTDYLRQIRKIEDAFGEMPITFLEARRITKTFLDWRDSMAASPRQADYAYAVLKLILNWANIRGLTDYRPPERVRKLYRVDRSGIIWTDEDIEQFNVVAPLPLCQAVVLALETGQRIGDLVRLPWANYDGERIRLKQSKTGRRVDFKATQLLKDMLDGMKRSSPLILTHKSGRPWKDAKALSRAFGYAKKQAGLDHLRFHDLRGTAITRLADAGCTISEIATITGHSQQSVAAIMDVYMARTRQQADNAIAKLEKYRS